MSFSAEKILGFLLLAVFAVSVAWLVSQPMEILLRSFLVDDAFYYFKPALNIVNGLGPTFDGENSTNGYHPLWMGILAAIYYFFPSGGAAPVYIALTLSLAFLYFTAIFFWKILSLFCQDRFLKSAVLLLFIVNPWVIANSLNGLETSLTILLFACFLWLFLKILYGENQPITFFFLGLSAGLLVLARVDYGLFLVAPVLYLIWKREYFGLREALYFFLPAIFLPLPWFLYNKIYFGSFFPTSGLAYTLINHQLFFYKARTALKVFLWSVYNFFGAAAFSLKTAGLPVFYEIKELWKTIIWMGGLYIFFPVALASYIFWKKEENFKKFLKELFNSPTWLGLVLVLAGFFGLLLAHGGIRWSGRPWYFAPFPILFLLGCSLVLTQKIFFRWRHLILIVLSVILLFSYISNWQQVFFENQSQEGVYYLALWIRDNLPQEAKIAAFNSGILGYFSNKFVMNSDGLINQAAYEAMRENRLWELFKKEKIDFIADYEVTLTYRFRSFFGIDDPMLRVSKIELPDSVASTGVYGGSEIGVYKIHNGNL